MRITQQDIEQALNCLEIVPAFLNIQKMPTYELACEALENLRTQAKQQRRLLAKRHHSDLGGSDEMMAKLNHSVDVVGQLQIQRPQPRPMVIFINANMWGGNMWSNSATSSYTNATTWG